MIRSLGELHPRIDPTAWVHEGAWVIGEVELGPRASVWPGCVLRGDEGPIVVGEESNIQDGTVAHNTGGRSRTHIGPRVTVGHRVVLHGCAVEGDALIGMGSVLMDNCHIEPWCIVAAGALVPPGRRIPTGSLAIGSPAKVARGLTTEEMEWIRHGCEEYLKLARRHGANHG